jgi:hypothetical protein
MAKTLWPHLGDEKKGPPPREAVRWDLPPNAKADKAEAPDLAETKHSKEYPARSNFLLRQKFPFIPTQSCNANPNETTRNGWPTRKVYFKKTLVASAKSKSPPSSQRPRLKAQIHMKKKPGQLNPRFTAMEAEECRVKISNSRCMFLPMRLFFPTQQ